MFSKDFGVKEKENVKRNYVIDFRAESRKSLFGSFAYSLFQFSEEEWVYILYVKMSSGANYLIKNAPKKNMTNQRIIRQTIIILITFQDFLRKLL